MRITYLSASTIPSRAANSVHVMKMCQAFAANGHEVTLYAQPGEACGDIFAYYGVRERFAVKLLRLQHLRQLGNYLFSWRIRREVGGGPMPDLFYGRHLMSLLLLSGKKRPLCYEVHDVPSSRFNVWLEARLFRKRNFARLVCISAALRDEYLRRCPGLSKEKLLVAHDGADDPGPEVGGDAGVELKRGRSGLRLGYIGQLYAGKGMEIVSQLAARMPEEVFHVVGGSDADIAAWKLKCSDNVVFHGFVPHGKLGDYVRSLDVALAPFMSRIAVAGGGGDIARFTSPLKLFEYMAYGKTIICSSLPVLREVLEDRRNAWLCSPERLDDWVAAIEALAADPGARRRLAAAARADFLEKHSWRTRAKVLVESLVDGV